MKTSETGRQFIKSHEGLRLQAYADSGGTLTIGYGHTGPDVFAGQSITQAQAESLFNADILTVENEINRSGISFSQSHPCFLDF